MDKSTYEPQTTRRGGGARNRRQPVAREPKGNRRDLPQTAMPFWAYLQPLVPGYAPLRLDKDMETSDAKYAFGTSLSADYNMNNDMLDEGSRNKLRYSMFTISKGTLYNGVYHICVAGNDCYLDGKRLGQAKQNIKKFHYISLGKNLPALFKIIVSPSHDYALPKDATIRVGPRQSYGEREHFLNTHMKEMELPVARDGAPKKTYLAFSYKKMDTCIVQIIKSEEKIKPECRPRCGNYDKYDSCEHLSPPDYVLQQHQYDCSYIVKLNDYVQMPLNLFLSFEQMPGGTLRERITKRGPLTPRQAKVFFNQLLGALQFLHRRTIVHGDVSLDHLLLANSNEYCRLKLCNLSYSFQGRKSFSQVEGTVAYKPPEALQGRGEFVLDSSADIWAFGVCLFESLSGIHPFIAEGQDEENMRSRICDVNYNFNLSPWMDIEQSCKQLIERTLQRHPSDRPDVAAIGTDQWIVEGRNNEFSLV